MADETRLPRYSNGAVMWDKVSGFREWFAATAPTSTNQEMCDLLLNRYGVQMNAGSVNQIRLRRRVGMTLETRRRAKTVATEKNRTNPVLPPIQQYEQELARREVLRLTARQTFYEMVGEKIIAAIRSMDTKLPPVRPPRLSFPKGMHEEEAVLVISDVQAGLTTSAKETGGIGEFNTQILLQEIDFLGQSVESIMKYHTNVKKLHVWFNGDIVEGEDIFGGQLREIDMNVVEQVAFCVEHFGRLLYRLAHRFETVECSGVVGNHGRIGRKGEHSPMANFDYLVYQWLRERTAPVKNIVWDIPETWWKIHDVQGWRFLAVHGDDTGQSTWGIPFYGMSRHKNRYQEMLRLSRQQGFDYVVLGHHSEAAEFQDIIAAGSWPGGTEFSIKRLQMIGVPSAPFFGVDKRHGKTWRRDIQLRPLRPR